MGIEAPLVPLWSVLGAWVSRVICLASRRIWLVSAFVLFESLVRRRVYSAGEGNAQRWYRGMRVLKVRLADWSATHQAKERIGRDLKLYGWREGCKLWLE